MNTLPQYLADHRFAQMFCDELGWDHASGTLAFTFHEKALQFEAIAQKCGLQVLHCSTDRRVLFSKRLLRQAQRQIARAIHEHILIYTCDAPPKQVWQWSVRLPGGRRFRHREHSFFSSAPPAPLVKRLGRLRFLPGEEAHVTRAETLRRVRNALDFESELDLFVNHPHCAQRSDELAVAMRNGDSSAFHEFVLFHRPLARHMFRRMHHWCEIDADDAEQIGVIGLIQAARRFDPELGIQFSTYSGYWVRQAYQRLGPDTVHLIRLPTDVVESFFPYRRHLEQVALQFGPARAQEELLQRCLANEMFYRQWQGFERSQRIQSLSDRAEPEYRQARQLPEPIFLPMQAQLHEEQLAIVRAAIDGLKPRQRRIVRLRHGFDGDPQTLKQIGRRVRLTRERVRQILKEVHGRLKRSLSLAERTAGIIIQAEVVSKERPPTIEPRLSKRQRRELRRLSAARPASPSSRQKS